MIEAVTTSPLFGIVLCIGTFQIGRWVQKKMCIRDRWYLTPIRNSPRSAK